MWTLFKQSFLPPGQAERIPYWQQKPGYVLEWRACFLQNLDRGLFASGKSGAEASLFC